ncbi:MAG TPA: 16S rRNA processing protein RimM [Acholeplasmatales bacterium]|nr:MAG: 16S rRNA processing protein RimM [Tenericutes bacterium GWF2_57_13]HAQ56361.1 16S rRNA processing protein RimM [Acholeplasmatales bacterium]
MALVPIGKIVNTHGLKGEVRILPSTDFQADRYAPGKTIVLDAPSGRRDLFVISYRPHRGFDLLTFDGIDTIEAAESLKGMTILAEEAAPVRLAKNEYRAAELIGLSVIQGGKTVGAVSGVREFPQGDYLEIRKNDGSSALVPFVDALVPEVDLTARIIVVTEMEGLL